MTDRFQTEGLPESYDADEVATALQRVADSAGDAVEEVRGEIPELPVSPLIGYPSWNDVRRLGLRYQDGTIGGADDVRLAYVESVDGDGRRAGMQRFRFDRGLQLSPLFYAPTSDEGATIQDNASNQVVPSVAMKQMAFGRLVLRIPHGLGRTPEAVVMRSSAGRKGPTSQRVIATGGGAIVEGTVLRCQVDFLPVLGVEAIDIERQLESILVTSAGLLGFGEVTAGQSFYAAVNLPDHVLSEAITTDRHFAGLLVATCWGLGSWQQGTQTALTGPPDTVTFDQGTAQLEDPASSVVEPMGGGWVPEVGKAVYTAAVAGATESIDSVASAGLRLLLEAGTVDFTMT